MMKASLTLEVVVLGKLQLICALGVALYVGFLVLQAQRQDKPVKAKALMVLGVLAVVGVYVVPALILATLYSLVILAVVLAVGGSYVYVKMLQRRKRRSLT